MFLRQSLVRFYSPRMELIATPGPLFLSFTPQKKWPSSTWSISRIGQRLHRCVKTPNRLLIRLRLRNTAGDVAQQSMIKHITDDIPGGKAARGIINKIFGDSLGIQQRPIQTVQRAFLTDHSMAATALLRPTPENLAKIKTSLSTILSRGVPGATNSILSNNSNSQRPTPDQGPSGIKNPHLAQNNEGGGGPLMGMLPGTLPRPTPIYSSKQNDNRPSPINPPAPPVTPPDRYPQQVAKTPPSPAPPSPIQQVNNSPLRTGFKNYPLWIPRRSR